MFFRAYFYLYIRPRGFFFLRRQVLFEDDEITDSQIDREFDKIDSPLARPLVIVRERPTRIIFPSSVCRSPFLNTDKRPGMHRFDRYMKSEEQWRNVGLPHLVEQSFFAGILKEKEELFEDTIDAYVSILATRPLYANIGTTRERVGVTSCGFMAEVDSVFNAIHNPDEEMVDCYNVKDFDPAIEENVPAELMLKLKEFATGKTPNWGVKNWCNHDKVLTICFFGGNFGMLKINLKKQNLKLYDPKAYKFNGDDKLYRLNVFMPMARIIPQVLKEIGYFARNGIKEPQYGQWDLTFGDADGPKACKEVDEKDCALYCIQYMERYLTRMKKSHALNNPANLCKYRRHIAQSIFGHSTDA